MPRSGSSALHGVNPNFKKIYFLGDLPNEKALGICWNLREDIFSFKLRLEARTLTKRVMLSMISSIYDPLGFAAPFILEGRMILQGLCNQGIQWKSEVSSVVKKDWADWVTKLKHIKRLHFRSAEDK